MIPKKTWILIGEDYLFLSFNDTNPFSTQNPPPLPPAIALDYLEILDQINLSIFVNSNSPRQTLQK